MKELLINTVVAGIIALQVVCVATVLGICWIMFTLLVTQ